MKGRRVFVSGGSGVIGLELVARLIDAGAVVLVGDLKPKPATMPEGVHYRCGDLNELNAVEVESFSPEVFIHLAATFERSTENYDFWGDNFWHNVRLSHHLMTLLKDSPSLQRVVFASSYLIYTPALYTFGEPQERPVSLSEDAPISPRNLTGMAKLSHEIELQFLNSFQRTSYSSVSARIFRGYGCGSRDIISRWIRELVAGRPIDVYRPEGIFDYIFAADSAEGLMRLADDTRMEGIVNLGTGRGRRVQEVVEILKKIFPGLVQRILETDIPYEASQADMGRFSEFYGWVPEHSLENAIPKIVDYERARIDDRQQKRHGSRSRNSFERRGRQVLLTSASKKAPLIREVRRALRKTWPEGRVIAGDISPNAPARYLADDFWLMPQTDDSNVESLLEGCLERGVRVVLPTRDGELLFWARQAPRFAQEGIHVVVSSAESLRVCLDKLEFYEYGRANELAFIPTTLDLDACAGRTYVVKERYGAGSREIGLALTYEEALEHASTLEEPIFQPFVEGKEISIDAWLDEQSRVKGLITRYRDHVVNGESQITTTFLDNRIDVQAQEVFDALKLRGPAVLQAFIEDSGDLRVIECNARIGGASTLSLAAGLDSIYWCLLEADGADIAQYPFVRVNGEMRLVRLPQDRVLAHSEHA